MGDGERAAKEIRRGNNSEHYDKRGGVKLVHHLKKKIKIQGGVVGSSAQYRSTALLINLRQLSTSYWKISGPLTLHMP